MSRYHLNKQSLIFIFSWIGKQPFCCIHLDENCHLVDTCALMKVYPRVHYFFSGQKAWESYSKFTSHANFCDMEPPMKKCKQYAGTFQSSWNGQFQGVVTPSKLGSNHAWCTVCYRNIKVAVSGVYDVHEHLKSKMHERQLKCPQVTSFFKLKTADSTDSTTKAVVSFAYFVAEHNLPTSLGDHGPPNVHRQRDCKVHKDHADHEMVFVDGRHKASRGAMSKRSVFHHDRQVDRQENGQATCGSHLMFRTEGSTHPIAQCLYAMAVQRHGQCLEDFLSHTRFASY